MTEYIERESALMSLCTGCEYVPIEEKEVCPFRFTGCQEYANIFAIPAADVVPVVRCWECKYGEHTGIEWFCDKHSGHADRFGEDASYHEYHSKYWFCADGERRNGK